MAVFGQGFTNALATGFRGQTLQEKLLADQLANKQRRSEVEEQQRRDAARRLLAETIAQMQGASQGQIPVPPRPAPEVKVGVPPGTEGTTFPGAGGTVEAPAPGTGIQGAKTVQAPGGAVPADMAGAAPGAQPAPQPQQPPAPGAEPFSYQRLRDELTRRTDIDPLTRYMALDEINKQLDKEVERDFKGQQAEANRLLKAQLATQAAQNRLDVAERRSQDTNLSVQQRADAAKEANATRLEIAQIYADAGITRVGMQQEGATTRTQMQTASRERMSLAQIGSREQIASAAQAIDKEYKTGLLDLRADEISKDFLQRERELDLREMGMNKDEAQFYAKLDQDFAVFQARDETTRRGQDMLEASKQAAREFKVEGERQKMDTAVSGAQDDFDAIYKDAERLITHPGMDNATGPLQSYLLTVQGDTADFEAAVDSLKAKIGFAALSRMRQLSPTGGALGNVSNKEVEFLQATIRSLSLRQTSKQFIQNLRDIMDNANMGKNKIMQAYEKQYGPRQGAGGDISTGSTKPKTGGETREAPPELAGEPDGTLVRDGDKMFIKRGNKLIETGE